MSTDRELLELAAKAAGIAITWGRLGFGPYHDPLPDIADQQIWNPLTDDGDALRLAVKLNLTVRVTDSAAIVFELCGERDAVELVSRHGDLCSATRRAIVRAAAAFGEAMP